MNTGIKVVWGVPPEIKPIDAPPYPGRMRLRFRNKAAGRVYFKTETSIRCFILEDKGASWFVNPILEQGRNQKLL